MIGTYGFYFWILPPNNKPILAYEMLNKMELYVQSMLSYLFASWEMIPLTPSTYLLKF